MQPAPAPAAPGATGGLPRRGRRAGAGLHDGAAQPEPDRRKLQELLRTLDKYNGPIDGNLQSDATVKAIQRLAEGPWHRPSSAS